MGYLEAGTYLDPAAGAARMTETADAVADAAALTSSAATGGDAPTEAEYNALRTDVNNLRTKINALLASLRASGQMES